MHKNKKIKALKLSNFYITYSVRIFLILIVFFSYFVIMEKSALASHLLTGASSLIEFLPFVEDAGVVISDKSNDPNFSVATGPPPLNISMSGAFWCSTCTQWTLRWVPGLGNNGLQTANVGPSYLTSIGSLDTKISSAIKASNQFSVEVWFSPANITQSAPIIALAGTPPEKNFSIEQQGDDIVFIMRIDPSAGSGTAGQEIYRYADTLTAGVIYKVGFSYDLAINRFDVEIISVSPYTSFGSSGSAGPAGASVSNWMTETTAVKPALRFASYQGEGSSSANFFKGTIYQAAFYDKYTNIAEFGGYQSTDHDNDGVVATVYGGTDCEDSNQYIEPGNAEQCDGLDNNCSDPDHSDGIDLAQIDETWKDGGFDDLGRVCTAGFGTCALSGTYVCNAALTATECSQSFGDPIGTGCNDSLDCTTPDACKDNGSGKSTCDGTAKVVGTECSDIDVNGCTYDTCNADKTCTNKASVPPNCVDTYSCTDNNCTSTSATTHTCSNPISATKCLIGGTCYNSGETQLGNTCSSCNPATPSVWTSSVNGTVCALDGNGCTYDTCSSGACTGGGNPPGFNDGLACTTDTCTDLPPPDNMGYILTHTTQALKCLITVSGTPTCFNEGDDDPSNICKECISATSNSSYSNKTPGSSCADTLFCNGAETCSAGACLSSSNPCPGPDGDSDCSETCNEAADACTSNDTTGSVCNDGLYCTLTDTCNASGVCGSTGNPCPGPDGDSDCSETCNEAADACTSNDTTGSVCNDGLYCTLTDTCNASGVCGSTGNPCPGPTGDGDSDCSEVCVEATDSCTGNDNNGAVCNDGNSCTTPDTCSAGTCGGPGLSCDDGNVCTADSCDAGGGCVHTPLSGTSCDDTLYCNGADTCNAGACTTHAGNPCSGPDGDANCKESCSEAAENCTLNDPDVSACNDGKSCTNTDQCAGGVCGGIANDALCNDSKECTDEVCNPASASANAATGCVITTDISNTCSDGSLCTTSDACRADATCQGTAKVCTDGLSCTDEACIPATGVCSASALKADYCKISNQCVSQGTVRGTAAVNKDYPCQECNTVVRTDDWSPRANTVVCNDLDSCTQNDKCDGAKVCKGIPISVETNCTDGADNDCDGNTDADDPDCVPKKPPVVRVSTPFNTKTGKVIFAFRKQVVQLDATKSYDPDGGPPLTFLWTVVSTVPAGIPNTLSNSSLVNPTFIVPNTDAIINLKVTGTDNENIAGSDLVTIVVSEDCRSKTRQ